MTSRSILNLFEQYQKARLDFARAISELSLKPNNIPLLERTNVLELLQPLLLDTCKEIQHCATVAVGRIAQNDMKMARELLTNSNCIAILIDNMRNASKHMKTCTLFVLRAVCKHEGALAGAVMDLGALEAVTSGLEDFDIAVKEAAAWAAGYLARHSVDLARRCVDAGHVPLLILCLQEPHLSLKQIAASALSDIAKHNGELAQHVVDAGAVPYLARALHNYDPKLKKQVLGCLSACARHSIELAEVVVDAEIIPTIYLHMAHQCPLVRKNATNLVKDIVKHSLEMTQLVVNTGGIGALMESLHMNFVECQIPCITAMGYIGGHSEQLAMTVLGCHTIATLATILQQSTNEQVLAVTVWTLGQIGKHSSEHANAIAQADIFPRLVQLYMAHESSDDLKFKCKTTLKMCLQKCLLLSALEPLLYDAPSNILKYILGQYSKVLPNDPKARRQFVTSGCLKRIQSIEVQPGTALQECVNIINSCFPIEIVRYYSPGYPDTLLDKVEQYSPQMVNVLHEGQKDGVGNLMAHTSSRELQNFMMS